MKLFLLSFALLLIGFLGIAVKVLLKKDGKFSGTCSSNNPFLNKKGEACGFCGAKPEEQCKK